MLNFARFEFRHWCGLLFSFLSLLCAAQLLWTSSLYGYKFRYGMELQGGVCLTFTATDEDVVKQLNQELTAEAKRQLSQKRVAAQVQSASEGVYVKSVGAGKLPVLSIQDCETQKIDANTLLLNYRSEYVNIQKAAMFNRVRSVVERRVDEYGMLGIRVYNQGDDCVVVEAPGATDPDELKEQVGKTGKLMFQLLSDSDEVIDFIDGNLVEDARVSAGNGEQIVVDITMNREGAYQMRRLSQGNIGKRLAVCVTENKDARRISAPVINSVLGGKFQITGLSSAEEAKELALMIRSGALPVPLSIVNEQLVGPDMGSDVVKSGILAAVMAIVAVVVLVLCMYSVAGIVAGYALLVNIALLLIFMAISGSTLTLPGIAGIAFAGGMAVDANVIVNENIRRALLAGKSWLYSVQMGYQNAMRTIAHSNITTFITAFVMYACGTGPIRGFAVTLSLGLLISLFTALVLTRLVMETMHDEYGEMIVGATQRHTSVLEATYAMFGIKNVLQLFIVFLACCGMFYWGATSASAAFSQDASRRILSACARGGALGFCIGIFYGTRSFAFGTLCFLSGISGMLFASTGVLAANLGFVMLAGVLLLMSFIDTDQLFERASRASYVLSKMRWRATLFSLVCSAMILGAWGYSGLNMGVDFTGGVKIEIATDKNIMQMREQVGHLVSSVQEMEGNKLLLKADSLDVIEKIKETLGDSVEYSKIDAVGPKLGEGLLSTCIYAIAVALICMWCYIAMSFGASYATVAVGAIIHDLVFILGVYSLLRIEFSEFAISAMLSTVGYSINDTIVVFDAVANTAAEEGQKPTENIVWSSIIRTLRRTVMTSVTTAVAMASVCIYGGATLFNFALPMLIGVIAGTYSSICLAGGYLVSRAREDLCE